MQFNNPIPRTGQPHFHEDSPLRSRRNGDAIGQAWKRDKTSASQLFALSHNVALLQRTIERMKKRLGGVGGGWDWHSPPGYDQFNDYAVGEATYVGSDNDAVTVGVNSGTDFAEPGVYLCVNTVSGSDPSNVKPPKAQPDPAVDGAGKWLSTVYWIQLAGNPASCPGG
jgi:hypothetical protein